MRKKTRVYLDMDGTVANLYGIENWLPRLRAEDKTIFQECAPMISEQELFQHFPQNQFEIIVLSMTPKGASEKYHAQVQEQKNEWLDRYFPSITRRIYRKYGHNKNLKNSKNAILVDDSEPIRQSWKGTAINPSTLWA